MTGYLNISAEARQKTKDKSKKIKVEAFIVKSSRFKVYGLWPNS
jgi:hypothetical protein